MHYSLKPGESYVYSVYVQADGPDAFETLAGNVIYAARVTEDGASMGVAAKLEPTRKAKEGRVLPAAGLVRYGLFRAAPTGTDSITIKLDPSGRVLRQTGGLGPAFAYS